ncbi:MAG: MNIO family bufferin maturase [bacterium]
MQSAIQGVGIGLRAQHFADIENDKPDIPWLEILTDNYLNPNSVQREYLQLFRQDYPMTFHGVGLSLGSVDPLNRDYLQRLKQLADDIQPAWISDHLCWTTAQQHVTHDLIPLPYTEEAIQHVSQRIQIVQDTLQQQILIENVSSYLQYNDSQMTEWAFIQAIVEQADCLLLLDVNNIYVSAQNHQFNPQDYLQAMPKARIREIHLAGYEDKGTHLLDTHSRAVSEPVWDLYAQTLAYAGDIPTLIEWDNDVPPLTTLIAEAQKAEQLRHARF